MTKCPLILFPKMFAGLDVDQMIAFALECGLDGYDLCLRQGHVVTPDNIAKTLPLMNRRMREAGLVLPMAEAEGHLTSPESPMAEPILASLDLCDIRVLKIGYFMYDRTSDFWPQMDRARHAIAGWARLARRFNVTICVHVHAGTLICNSALLMRLLEDQDPAEVAGYIDPAHQYLEGESVPMSLAMTRSHLRAVGLKDLAMTREQKSDHGSIASGFSSPAGEGVVDWEMVFTGLSDMGFNGPLSIHGLFLHYADVPREEYVQAMIRETDFFKRKRDLYLNASATGAVSS